MSERRVRTAEEVEKSVCIETYGRKERGPECGTCRVIAAAIRADIERVMDASTKALRMRRIAALGEEGR